MEVDQTQSGQTRGQASPRTVDRGGHRASCVLMGVSLRTPKPGQLQQLLKTTAGTLNQAPGGKLGILGNGEICRAIAVKIMLA